MNTYFKKHIPIFIICIGILLFNNIIAFIYPFKDNIYVPSELLLFISFNFILTSFLRNKYNKIIAQGWIAFFFIGILNINSVKRLTNIWNLRIDEASYFYFFCLFAFNLALLFFEWLQPSSRKKKFNDDLVLVSNSPFSISIYFFPFLFFISVLVSLGFIPIMSGMNFVDQMYEYDYGPLYGFKFICTYSFLLGLILVLIYKKNVIGIIYLLLVSVLVTIDGKRLVLLICMLALIPAYFEISKLLNKKSTTRPIIISFVSIVVIYIVVNAARVGTDLSIFLVGIIDKIPFGVEYKDYVHSFNIFNAGKIKEYNFEISAFASLMNSSLLNILGLDKQQLVHMGSAYVWMKLYNIDFGIRTGIISELYFAYGDFAILGMVVIAYFANRINNNILNPTSYFNLMQNSILFALTFLLINGQATVFFGCLPIMIYVYVFFKIIGRLKKETKDDIHCNTGFQQA